MATRAEWIGVLGFALLFGVFFGLILGVGVMASPPVDTGLGFLENAIFGVVVGIVLFVGLGVGYLLTLGETNVERDSLQPEWKNLKPDLSQLRRNRTNDR